MSDPQILEALFVFCMVWSIGACIVQVGFSTRGEDFINWVCVGSTVDGNRRALPICFAKTWLSILALHLTRSWGLRLFGVWGLGHYAL